MTYPTPPDTASAGGVVGCVRRSVQISEGLYKNHAADRFLLFRGGRPCRHLQPRGRGRADDRSGRHVQLRGRERGDDRSGRDVSGPGASAPTLAAAGTYIPVTGATSAAAEIVDPAGAYSLAGASAPATDPAGRHSAAGASAPTLAAQARTFQ